MAQRIAKASPRTWARVAGGVYLIQIISGFFAVGFVPAAIVVHGDPAATAHNILTHETLYRIGLAAHVIAVACNIPLAVIFYELFKVVNKKLSMFVAGFILVGAAVEGASLFNKFAPLILLRGSQSLPLFQAQQLQAQAYAAIELQAVGFNISTVLFGLSIVLTGYLVFRSTFLPRIVGVLLAIGGACYVAYSFAAFLAPGFAAHLVPYIQLPSLLGEASLCLCLIVTGVNVSRWEKQAGGERSVPPGVPARAAL